MIRSLDGVGWDVLAAAFNAAFSDYAVPLALPPDAFAAMQMRRGYVACESFGAWHGDALVAFALTCRDGDRAYNSGTGVVPGHRRGGLARTLVERVIATIDGATYVLEALETNTGAIALYGQLGFAITRRFQCWSFASPGAALPEANLALEAIATHADVALSWQNSVASIRRASGWVALGDDRGGAIVFPATGDVPLLAVRRDARRQGIGKRLLAACAAVAGKPLRINNLDDRDPGIAAFLAATGATATVRQVEMTRG